MEGTGRQAFDSLLDLDTDQIDDIDSSIDFADNNSPTLPPTKFPHAVVQKAISPIETQRPNYSQIVDPGIPVEHIEARQAETTKPIRRIDVEDLSDGIPRECMVTRLSEMSIEALMKVPGDRIALLLAKI